MTGDREVLLSLVGVHLGYGRKTVLREVDLSIRRGDFLGVVGPNGSGKTTLLRALLGILRPQKGEILRQPSLPLRAGYVPQQGTLDEAFPLTVRDIVLMGRYGSMGLGRRPQRQDHERVYQSAAVVGVEGLLSRRYRELSGGQKQRVLLARALAAEPNLLILDEPTSGMDLCGEKAFMDLVRSLHETQGLTVVLVSHLLHVVASYVKRLALVGEGRLWVGPLEEMLRSEKLSQIYQTPVRVHHWKGRYLVFVGEGYG